MTAHDFEAAIRDLRPALKRHCYRMTAAPQEAEDCVQETCLRAWRSLDTLGEGAALKPWLYSIATHVCLDSLRGRKRRLAVHNLLEEQGDLWVEPLADPGAQYESRETLRLAFISLLQTLAPKARAALILHDVLDWTAAEAARALDLTLPATRSLIQRSRKRLAPQDTETLAALDPLPIQHAVLARYIAAWEARDLDAFGKLLQADAVYVMPPLHQVHIGPAAITAFFAWAWPYYDGFRFVPVMLNGQAGAALYARSEGEWRAKSIHILDVVDGGIARLTLYIPPLGPDLFEVLGMEGVLS